MPTVGWVTRSWKVRAPCVTCGRRIRGGVVHVRDHDDPPVRALCHQCHTLLMDDPAAFEAAHDLSRA